MTHPKGKYISTSQDHELNYWLSKQGFRETQSNRDLLIRLIDTAKLCRGKEGNDHLEHAVLDDFFDITKETWKFARPEREQ